METIINLNIKKRGYSLFYWQNLGSSKACEWQRDIEGGMPPEFPNNVRQLREFPRAKSILGRRWRIQWRAELRWRNEQVPCFVEDISDRGAKLRLSTLPDIADAVTLLISNFNSLTARVAWVRGDYVGIRFEQQQLAPGKLARIAAMSVLGRKNESGR